MAFEIVPKNSPYYDGSPVVFVDNDHFVHNSGANLRVTNSKNGITAGFIYPTEQCPRGISAYNANPKCGLLAIAKRCRPPVIDVVAWPGKGASDNGGPPFISQHLGQELKATATGGAALEYGHVALSRKGERLAAISVLADYILTVWDLPLMGEAEQLDYSDGRAPKAVIVATIVLPCVCDTVSFNPANPSMIAVTASSAHHDGVGGGHAGGLFLYNVSTSHGHTSLVLTETHLDQMPKPFNPHDPDVEAQTERSSDIDHHDNWDEDGHVGDGHGAEEDEEEALHRGYHPHADGGTSVNVAVWGPNDVIYVGTSAGVVGKFYAVTGEFLQCWNRGLDNGTVPQAVVGLVLTKNFLVVASKERMLYWLNIKNFDCVEHTATIFGIRNLNPPERVAQMTFSPNFRSLLVTTMEGTMHQHTVEPPADKSKRSIETGIPDILPILLDYHEAFVLCATSTHLPFQAIDQKTDQTGPSEEFELFITGGSDGNLRVWWACDGKPATAKSYRALKPSIPVEVSEYDSDEDIEADGMDTLGDDQDAIEALGDDLAGLDEEGIGAVSEAGSDKSDEEPEDPFEMPAVPVTAVAVMPGRPLVAVGLADGLLSLVLLHDESLSAANLNSNDSVSSEGSRRSRQGVHPSGTRLDLLPLDLKQLCRKPITHLSFVGGTSGSGGTCLLAVASATEGSVHIIEMTEPEDPRMDTISPPLGGPPASIFRVVARFEVGIHNHDAMGTHHGSVNGSLAGSVGGSKGHRISALSWSSIDALMVGTSDGAVYTYDINVKNHITDQYNPIAVVNTAPFPIALLRNAGANIDPLNGGSGLTPQGDDSGDVSPITNLIIVPKQPDLEAAIEGGTLIAISPAAKTPILYKTPPLSSSSLQRVVNKIKERKLALIEKNNKKNNKSKKTKKKNRKSIGGGSTVEALEEDEDGDVDDEAAGNGVNDEYDDDEDLGAITGDEDEEGNIKNPEDKSDLGVHGLPLLDMKNHPSVLNSYIQQGHPLGIGCASLCNLDAGSGDGTCLLATGGLDGILILWRISNEGATRVGDFQVHASAIIALTFSSSGSYILSVDLNRSVIITTIEGLTPAPLSPFGSGTPSRVGGGSLSDRIGSGEDGEDMSMMDNDSVNESNAPVKKGGFEKVAMLKRASSIEVMNQARQQQRNMSYSSNQRPSPAEEEMAAILAMGNLNGPLPAPNSVPTWFEAANSSSVISATKNMAVTGGRPALEDGTGGDSAKSDISQTKDNSKVMDLAIRLEDLLVKNDNATDLEKLPREVFVVDIKRRDAALAINKARAARVREESEEEDAARDLISARILSVCEARMEVKVKEVRAMKIEHCTVPNLAIPKLTKLKSRALECIQRLRMVEIKEIRYAKKNFFPNMKTTNNNKNNSVWSMPREIPEKISWVLNQGLLIPKVDVVGVLLEEKNNVGNEKSKKKSSSDGEDNGSVDNDGGGDGSGGAVENKDGGNNNNDDDNGKDDDDNDEKTETDSVNKLDSSKMIEEYEAPLDPDDILTYMYPPTCLNTTAQRRSQVIFLGELVRNIKLKFNDHVEKLASMKLDDIEKILERNLRIEAIAKDLGLVKKSDLLEDEDNDDENENNEEKSNDKSNGNENEENKKIKPETYEIFTPILHDTERPENFLFVKDEEMELEPYETEEMKEKKRKIEADRLAKEMASKKDDLGTRALMDMMYGTLETKKDGALEKVLDPMPDWMAEMVQEQRLDEMTEEQMTQYDEYMLKAEEFEKAKQAEKDILLEEMHRLNAEVQEIVTNFDNKVAEIRDLRVHAQLAVATQELYMMRLGVGLEEGESLGEAARVLEDSKYKVNIQKIDLDEQALKWHKQVEVAKEQLASLQEEDARIEKHFRKSLNEVSEEPITNDVYKVYLSLFKIRRESLHQGSGMNSTGAARSSNRGPANRRNTRATVAKPSLMAAAGSLMGARRQTGSKGVGFMGVLKAASKDDEAKIQAEAADPFSELDSAAGGDELSTKKNGNELSSAKRLQEAAEQAAYAPLDPETDIPDGFKISKAVWDRLQSMRTDKVKCEINIRKMSKKVHEMTKSSDNIDKRDESIAEELKCVEQEMALLERRRSRNTNDFEIIAQLHQGQNELLSSDLSFLSNFTANTENKHSSLPKSNTKALLQRKYPKLSIDMSGGIIVDTENILELNEAIKAVGAEKVKALNKIKHFRKSINFMTWEDKYMRAKLQDLEEFYTDLLLLRVEKSTLQAMRGGGPSVDQDELAVKHERREEMTKSAFAVKEQRQIAMNNKLAQQIQDRRKENEKLREQLSNLEGNIKVREAIYRARVPGGADEMAVANRMRKVTMRRRLVDLARVQTEEIDFLRGELDRLRQRTFPSFAHAAKHRLQLPPDEII